MGGKKIKGGETSQSSYKMDLYFTLDNSINEIRRKEMPDVPYPTFGNFKCVCSGRFIVGGGRNDENIFLNDVMEFVDIQEWKPLPRLNISRSFAASCFVRNSLLVVGGGLGDNYNWIDSIEILRVEKCDNDLHWSTHPGLIMPSTLKTPTFNYLAGKIILIGTEVKSSDDSLAAWEGTLISKQQIKWKNLPSPNLSRSQHFSVTVMKKIYMFGGTYNNDDKIEIFDGEKWEIGPKFPYDLSTKNAQAVVDTRGRIIITTNYNGIITYDTTTGYVKGNEKSHQVMLQWYSTLS